jgi:hypothetical protein
MFSGGELAAYFARQLAIYLMVACAVGGLVVGGVFAVALWVL